MKRVAVFGNAGGGKSTLARRLADITGLPLLVLDKIGYDADSQPLPEGEFQRLHTRLIEQDEWIIDGYGSVRTAWERFAAADTLVHVDLPLSTHVRWVTKRLVQGLFSPPSGWPENAPVWSSSMRSYRVLWRCHRHLTPRYRQLVSESVATKQVHHLRSPREIAAFLRSVEGEKAAP